jgi:hypothetical protein
MVNCLLPDVMPWCSDIVPSGDYDLCHAERCANLKWYGYSIAMISMENPLSPILATAVSNLELDVKNFVCGIFLVEYTHGNV